jgi:A/G-specific adenine glycosylase
MFLEYYLVILIETDIALLQPKKNSQHSLSYELMPKNDPAIFNQAIMEFALQCVPKSPDCTVCVLIVVVLHIKKKK